MSAISALRQLEKEKGKKPNNNSGLSALFGNLPSRSIAFAKKTWNASSWYIWVFSTSMLITLVPLSIELLREEQTNEVVKELLGKGFSYNQIQSMGYQVTPQQNTLAADAAQH